MFAAVEASTVIPRSIHQAFRRNERMFEDTLPHLREHFFKQSFPVQPVTFTYLVDVRQPHMEREVTSMRSTIPVEKRVGSALCKLCSRAEDRTIANLFGLGRSTVTENYREFCRAVVSVLEQDGALDGCHFPISSLKVNASDCHNYTGWYSIILLALADHRYRFRYVNVGAPGWCHDAHVQRRSAMVAVLQGPTLQMPMVTVNGTTVLPLILCDQAFSLTSNVLKPYPRKDVKKCSLQKGFKRQLSSARRVAENAFGRVKARLRFIMKRMEYKVDKTRLLVRACCNLNNVYEHFNDGVEPKWLSDLATEDKIYLQPVCTADAEAEKGQSVRDAIAGSAPRSSTPLHQPTAAEMAPNPPGSVSGTSPAGLRWWAAVVGLFWCCRLHDRLTAPHRRPARTATPGSSGVSTVPVMLCGAVAATVKCLELELSGSSILRASC
ncbi:hypothetical protein ISCGN_013869 [Ixodes scapularis]